MQRPIALRALPSSDPAFARAARRLAEDAASPRDLEARLRALYPETVVRERGLSSEGRVLYLYRDGRFEPDEGDRWWERDDVPVVVIDIGSGTILDATDSWALMLNGGRENVQGRPFRDFLLPEAVDAANAAFEAVVEEGELTSRALMRRENGSLIPFRIHARRVGDRLEVRYRRLDED